MDDKKLPAVIRSRLSEIERERKRALGLVGHAIFAEQIKEKFTSERQRPYLNINGDNDYISLGIRAKNMEDVAQVLRYAAELGYNQTRDSEDAGDTHNFRYYFLGGIVLVVIFADENESSEPGQCRYVQTGTKTVPVMELVCGK